MLARLWVRVCLGVHLLNQANDPEVIVPCHASSNITHRDWRQSCAAILFINTTVMSNILRCVYGNLQILKGRTSSPHLLLFLECKNTAVYELLNSPSHHTLPDLSIRDLHSPGTTKSIYTGKPLRCTFHCSSPWPTQSFTSLIHLHWNCTSAATWLIDLLFPRT